MIAESFDRIAEVPRLKIAPAIQQGWSGFELLVPWPGAGARSLP